MDTPQRAAAGEGSVFLSTKRAKGREYHYWVAQWSLTDENGRRKFITGSAPASMGEVRAKQLAIRRRNAKLEKLVNSGEPLTRHRRGSQVKNKTSLEPLPVAVTLRTLMERWLSNYPPDDLSISGRDRYRREFELHLAALLDRDVTSLNKQALEQHFYRTLPGSGCSKRSTYNAFAALRTCMRWAVKDELIAENPLRLIRVKRPKIEVREDDDKWIRMRTNVTKYMLKWLSDASQCGDELHDRYPLILMMLLGLRRGELLGLEWKCFNNLNRKGQCHVVIRQQLHRRKGQGWFIYPHTKTDDVRTIFIPELWRKALLAEKKKARVATEDWASDLVFLMPAASDGRSRWIDYNTYNRLWHDTLTAYHNKNRDEPVALLPSQRWRPHAQRHVTASLLFDAGVSLEVVQKILGHSDQAMTAYYTHPHSPSKIKAVLTLEETLNGPPAERVRTVKRLSEDPKITDTQREALQALLDTLE